MTILFYDPPGSFQHQYVTQMYLDPLRAWMTDCAIAFTNATELTCKGSVVIINADHLAPGVIERLKNGGNRIAGFSCTDSSYVSQACRAGNDLKSVDLMFMLTGLQTVNHGRELVMAPDYKLALEDRQFLPEEDWAVFNSMREEGRLQSLPYCHWSKQPDIISRPYGERSQKALIRGGHHMRRFLLCLQLMKYDLLDVNSSFYTAPYFMENMNPQFRYCGQCRSQWSTNGRNFYPYGLGGDTRACINKHKATLDVSNLGEWNNSCPESFYKLAQKLGAPMAQVEKLMNGQWIRGEDHLAMLARITFTSDLKWLFSIYAAQRFWDAAMSGCVNVLPKRTADQEYFPEMKAGVHYLTYDEDMVDLDAAFTVDEIEYLAISSNAFAMYQMFMRPTKYAIGTPILERIWQKIQEHCE